MELKLTIIVSTLLPSHIESPIPDFLSLLRIYDMLLFEFIDLLGLPRILEYEGIMPAMVVHACNPNTQEAETGGLP